MPALLAFGRRWNIASDDFVFPGLTEAFVRIIWLVVSFVFMIFHSPFECVTHRWIPLIVVTILINFCSAVLALLLTVHSSCGSIMQIEKRRHVKTMIYIRLALFLIEILWAILSTIIIFEFYGGGSATVECCSFVLIGYRTTLLLEWFLIVSFFFGFLVVFNPAGGNAIKRSLNGEQSCWKRLFFLFKIRQTDEVRVALDEIAAMFASLFMNTDFVFSDFLAGLLLHLHSPNKRPLENRDYEEAEPKPEESGNKERLSNEPTRSAAEPIIPDWMCFPQCFPTVARFLDISISVYGWPQYFVWSISSPCFLLYQVMTNLACCRCFRRRRARLSFRVEEDGCCNCNSNAVPLMLDKNCEIVFTCFRNQLFSVPFVVLLDHKTRSIVVAIRGSQSLVDFFTDLSLNDECLTNTANSVDVDTDSTLRQDPGLDNLGEVRVHKGMLRCARYIFDLLSQRRTIEHLRDKHPDYGLTICGHSLGAGIGALLTLLLKQSHPEIRCYGFSPPGSVITENGIPDTESHILNVILGDDVIPRMSYHSIHALKSDIERELISTDRAKFEILIKGIFKLLFSAPWELHSPTTEPTNNGEGLSRLIDGSSQDGHSTVITVTTNDLQPNRSSISGDIPDCFSRMLRPPGRLLHLVCTPNFIIEANWAQHQVFSEIKLSSMMITDHLPYKLRKVMKKVLEQHKQQNATSYSDTAVLLPDE